jgi:hypothetical protein
MQQERRSAGQHHLRMRSCQLGRHRCGAVLRALGCLLQL